jgi:hypothetical protein
MKKILAVTLVLLAGISLSMNVLAWTRLPDKSTETKPAKKVTKPTTVPTVQPALPKTVPVTPAQALPSSNTVQPETTKPPVVKPAVIPLKPAPAVKAKSQPPHAAKSSPSIEWIVGAGYELGGEELGQVTYSDGSSAPVNANNGIMLNFGGIFPNGEDSDLSTQVSLGYKTGGPRIWSSDVNWSAIPLEIIEHYRISRVRLGLGIAYHINPQLKVNLPSSSFVSKYNNALGFILQFSWAPVREDYSVDLRYTSIRFQQSDVASAPAVNGSVAGIFANYRF